VAPEQVDAQTRHVGHAAVDFIAQEFGKSGLRRFLFALRIGSDPGGPTAYETAFGVRPDEFDREFGRFLQERFAR
jgi:hypothetical protein